MRENHQQDTSTTGVETPALEPLAPAATQGSCCGGSSSTAAAPASPEHGEVAECPVMAGIPVNKAQAEAAGLFRDYRGQRYWPCCAGCGPMWDADPDEYAAA